jgi:TonB family protein
MFEGRNLMKNRAYISWLIAIMLLVPMTLVSQKAGKEGVQHKKVSFLVKQGDSTVKHDVDVAYDPSQEKQKAPPDYVPYEQAPEVLNQEQPIYPKLALKAGLEGTVWIKLWVDTTGRVFQAYVQKSDAQIFEQSALEAARQWRFKPALMKGKPISTWVSVPFRFKIADKPTDTQNGPHQTKSNTIFGRWNESQVVSWLISAACLAWLGLTLRSLQDIVQGRFPEPNDKLMWTVIVIFIPIFGAMLYFTVGRKQKVLQSSK